jgi:tetratricopeptide (TPR) repeat protein
VRSRPLEMDALLFQTRDGFVVLSDAAGPAGQAYDTLALTMKHPGALLCSGMRSVFVRTLNGHFAAAEREAREFYERDRARNMAATGTFELQMIMLSMLRGDHEQASTLIERMGERSPNVPWFESARAREHAFAGRRAEAESQLRRLARDRYRQVEERHGHSCLGAYFMLAETCAELGDARLVGELYECMLPYKRLMASPFLGTIWHGSMIYALGLAATVLGRIDSAVHYYEGALALARSQLSPPMIAMAQERLGSVLLQHERDTTRGAELVARALETGERLGMQDVVRRARRWAGRVQCAPDRESHPPPNGG